MQIWGSAVGLPLRALALSPVNIQSRETHRYTGDLRSPALHFFFSRF